MTTYINSSRVQFRTVKVITKLTCALLSVYFFLEASLTERRTNFGNPELKRKNIIQPIPVTYVMSSLSPCIYKLCRVLTKGVVRLRELLHGLGRQVGNVALQQLHIQLPLLALVPQPYVAAVAHCTQLRQPINRSYNHIIHVVWTAFSVGFVVLKLSCLPMALMFIKYNAI